MTKIRVGVIGAGYIGGVHAGILARDERVQITGVYDVDQQRAQRLARAHDARVTVDSSELIGRSDAVYIATPNTQHVSLALAAIDAGKHIFCEKPLATTIPDAESVFSKAKQLQSVFQVGHNRRFAPVYATLKQLLTEKHRPHSAHVKMNRGELLNPVWTGDPNITGGFLYETPIHLFDMMRFLFGEVESLHAIGSKHEYREVDDFSVLLKFANGMHATLATAADASWLFPFERVEVFCHHATLVTREMETLVCSTNLEGHFTEQSMQQLAREEKWGYLQEDRAFVDSIISGTPPLVTALDGLMSVELVNAVYESVRTNATIAVRPVPLVTA
jgi:myo-inositol 2-dehydrogenase/D-chiro-inositol 1-dehydrogenase